MIAAWADGSRGCGNKMKRSASNTNGAEARSPAIRSGIAAIIRSVERSITRNRGLKLREPVDTSFLSASIEVVFPPGDEPAHEALVRSYPPMVEADGQRVSATRRFNASSSRHAILNGRIRFTSQSMFRRRKRRQADFNDNLT